MRKQVIDWILVQGNDYIFKKKELRIDLKHKQEIVINNSKAHLIDKQEDIFVDKVRIKKDQRIRWKDISENSYRYESWLSKTGKSNLIDLTIMIAEEAGESELLIVDKTIRCFEKLYINCHKISFGKSKGYFLANSKITITSDKNMDIMPDDKNIKYIDWEKFSDSKNYRDEICNWIQNNLYQRNSNI